MKLLVVAQEVHEGSSTLGFFPAWLRELAPGYERIEVICLSEGTHTLPENVRVHSLGKEAGKRSSLSYALRFLSLAWRLRHSYDAVFVHMNEEYLLIAGWLWKLLGKRVYLWRNHYSGTWRTDLAVTFATGVFCTSTHSYTAKYAKTKIMPVGVELTRFAEVRVLPKRKKTILFLARMAPSKRPDMLIYALSILHARSVSFIATLVGSPLSEDEGYYASLKQQVEVAGLGSFVSFVPGVPHEETAEYFGSHEIFVNCSRSGMFDKTLFEAAAAGSIVLAISEDFAQKASSDCSFTDAVTLARRLEELLQTSEGERERIRTTLGHLVEENSLDALARALRDVIL